MDDVTTAAESSLITRVVRGLGLIAFVASLTLLVWWWAGPAGRGDGDGGWLAASLDVVLFGIFALHHSVLARAGMKRLVTRVVGAELVRTAYVLVASLLLTLVCLCWQPVGGTLYDATGAAAWLMRGLQLAAAATGLLAIRRISLRELAGLRRASRINDLQWAGPYRYVRHPLYLATVLLLLASPRMTADRLLFALLVSVYVVAAMPFEEADLLSEFGDQYRAYRREVRWRLIPYIH